MPPASLAVAGFLAVGLLALAIFGSARRLADLSLVGLVLFLIRFIFLLQYVPACWLLDVRFDVMCSAFAAASSHPLTLAQCFATLGSDRFGGLLGCWVSVVWFLFCSISLLKCMLAR